MNNSIPQATASIPVGLELDKQRVSVLLLINTILIQKAVEIQRQIQELTQQPTITSINPKLAELLQQILKRLHANLTCIGELSEKQNKPHDLHLQRREIFPGILVTIPDLIELNEPYNRLRLLFPAGVALLQRQNNSDPKQQQFMSVLGQASHQQSPLSQPPINNQFQQQYQPSPASQSHQPASLTNQPQPIQSQFQLTPQFSQQQSQIQDHFQRQQQLRMLQQQQQHKEQQQLGFQNSPTPQNLNMQMGMNLNTNMPLQQQSLQQNTQPPQMQQQGFW